MKSFSIYTAILGLAGLAKAHMEMKYPPPFKSKWNPNAGWDIDYSMTSPLSGSGSDFPCKGYHSLLGTTAGQPTATWQAGQQYTINIVGGADHAGGSCQVSLSFDQGSTWTAIHSWIGNCPVMPSSSFTFVLPADTPAGQALFAWSWFNKIGNREMYMNCAPITIQAAANPAVSTPMRNRPAMFVANVGNGCGTTEMIDLQFPNPGPDVSKSSTNTGPPVGNCPAGSGSNPPAVTTSEPVQPTTKPATPTTKAPTRTTTSTSRPGGIFITVNSTTTLSTTTRKTTTAQPTPTKTPVGAIDPGTACQPEGYWNCVGGTMFQRCASGRWSVLMNMAAGTKCRPGQSADFVIMHAR